MKLGIDLHNIRDGGGVKYMSSLLQEFDPDRHGFSKVCLFGSAAVLAEMPDAPHIEKRAYAELIRSLPYRLFFVLFKLDRELRAAKCSALYSPGGLYFGSFRPLFSISRNMMPFTPTEWARYPRWSFDRLRLWVLRWANSRTFRRADGMIFLTELASQTIRKFAHIPATRAVVVAHGVNRQLFTRPRGRDLPSQLASNGPIRLVYPSRLEPYKHQVELIRAVARLKADYPGLTLRLCGPVNKAYAAKVAEEMRACDPKQQYIKYEGYLDVRSMIDLYGQSDILMFTSACENLPNTLIEALAYGIPVVSSDRAPMPEVAKECCLYCDPADSEAIANAVQETIEGWGQALVRVQRGMHLAQQYSWAKCADQTFEFLYARARDFRGH